MAPGAVSSIVWGILGLFICGLIFGLLAISRANAAKKLVRGNPHLYTGDGLATFGLVLGVIDLVGWGIVVVVNLGAMGS